MNFDHPIDVLNFLLATLGSLGSLAFVVVYARWGAPMSTAPGRAVFFAFAALDLLAIMNAVHLFTGPYPGMEFVRMSVWIVLTATIWNLVRVLVVILRSGRPITAQSFMEPKAPKE